MSMATLTTLQAAVQEIIDRITTEVEVRKRKLATVKLQAATRGSLTFKEYYIGRKMMVKLQAHVRGANTRRSIVVMGSAPAGAPESEVKVSDM